VTPRIVRAGVGLIVLGALGAAGACAARLYSPPTGPGTPFAEASAVWSSLSARCRDARVFVGAVRVNGWVGASKERFAATLFTALTRENNLFFEYPGWIQMAGRDQQAVLILPRDKRVLREPTRAIVEALTGLNWDAVDLLNALTGCVTNAASEVDGQTYGDRASVDLGPGARAWVHRSAGTWQLKAAERDALLIEYREWNGAFPSDVRVSSTSRSVTPLQLTFRISEHQVNIPLDASVFSLPVPPGYIPMTLDELRTDRPLKDGKGGG
jgi:hypothetical protein